MLALWLCGIIELFAIIKFIPFVYRFGIPFRKIKSKQYSNIDLKQFDNYGKTKSANYKIISNNKILFRVKTDVAIRTPLMFKGYYKHINNNLEITILSNTFITLFLLGFPIMILSLLISSIINEEITLIKLLFVVLFLLAFILIYVFSYRIEKKQIKIVLEELNERFNNLFLIDTKIK